MKDQQFTTQARNARGAPTGAAVRGAPDFIRYGAGIAQFGKFYGHNGAIFGFNSQMWHLPEKDAVIVINVNRMDADDRSQSDDLFFQLTKLLFPQYVNW